MLLAVGLFLSAGANHLTACAAEPVNSMGVVEARAFLDQYRSLSEAQNVDFYDLYSDRAVVHAHGQGQDKGFVFQGRAYKQWGHELLQNRRGVLDASVFLDATVEQRGGRLVMRAKRYSTTRCYWDPTYQVGIEREGLSYRIVDERLTTNPGARCDARSAKLPAPGNTDDSMAVAMSSSSLAAPNASIGSSWHPMSQDEIAETALRIAQQTAAKYASQVRPATLPLVGVSAAPAAPARSTDLPSELWVTP